MTRIRIGSMFGPHTVLGRLALSSDRLSGDRGSLPLAMMISTVGMMLAGLVLPAVILQIKGTKNTADRVRALHAAQSGLDAALAEIRAANDGNGNGLKSKLPCGPIAGTTSVATAARYSTEIYYFGVDPQSHAEDTTWINANKITCTAGSGTATVPAFALLKSRGTDYATGTIASAKGRSLRATYPLQTTIGNIAGGQIHNNKFGVAGDLCIDAGSGTPAVGSKPTMETCVTGDAGQQWAYNPKLNLVLVASKTAAKPYGMCLDAQYPHSFSGTVPLVINNCSNPATERQQWSYNDASNFEGNTGGALDGYCFAPVGLLTAGSQLDFGTSNCNGSADSNTFRPAAQVGAGAAGLSTKQWVNFSMFGRCIDASLQNGATAPAVPSHVLAWPCKQAPSASALGWNEVWTFPTLTDDPNGVQGRIKATDSAHSDVWCLQSALVSHGKVTLLDCSGSLSSTVPDPVRWTVFRETGTYSTSYRIQDANGYCLQPDPNKLTASSSDLDTEVCSDSTIQKWNAPPMLQSEPLKDLGEN
ncbi:MAG: hypothetical protein QOJ50_1129 [Cryptosporangiaceae bacterium]|nr:hypothetical protein [Cryptosporangiaceae bacterium]